MIDLCILVVLFAASFSLAAWILARSARAVGSNRASLRHGALAAFLTFVCGLVFLALSAWPKTLAPIQILIMAASLLVIENLAAYAIYRRVFRLSAGRAFAPWGAMFGPPHLLAGRFRLSETSYAYPVHYQEGQTIALGNNEFFFIGDNVEISLDSRLLGPSDRGTIIGVADLIYWPVSRWRILR
jgi:hypothetical protein